jgi:hypothetical protein
VSAYQRSLQSLRDDLQRLGRTTILTALIAVTFCSIGSDPE